MNVFSFCIYGSERNYYEGLLENVQIIRTFFPDFDIYVYKGLCDPTWTFEGVKVIETNREGAINMMYRYLPLTFAKIGFVRDADSRITERDRWTIQEFLKSDKKYHIIRDHVFHKSKIMGGLFGWKQSIELSHPLEAEYNYGDDEAFLASSLYPRIWKDALVHTNIRGFHGEHVELITIPQKDPSDFIGNVIWNGAPKFTYGYNLIDVVNEMSGQDQFKIVQYITNGVYPTSIQYEKRSTFFDKAYIANFYLGDMERAQYWLRQYEFAELTQHTYQNASFLFSRLGKRIIASFDPKREPGEDELVIVYGNYPDWYLALPGSNKLFRHASLFWDLKHDVVEYHPAWEAIDILYILNLEERKDRFYDMLLTLCSVRAPLHRIHHYKAKKDGSPPYVGATKNHVDVVEHFCASGASRCLILEDDFLFIDDHETVWSSLGALAKRHLHFNVCFLSLSKTGRREPYNELLSRTLQSCTTSSGYILQKDTAPKVLETIREGLQLIQKGNHHGCIDRYWSILPDLYVFRTKLGYQRPSYSNLIGTVSDHLD
jgi:hypothetical protein